MHCKLGQIVTLIDGGILAKIEQSTPRWNYRLHCARFVDAVREEYRRYRKLHGTLVQQYGAQNPEKPEEWRVDMTDPEKGMAFSDAMMQLLETELDLAITPLSSELLGDSANLTVGEVRLLSPFLVE